MSASTAPRIQRKKEHESSDIKLNQKAPIAVPGLGEELIRGGESVGNDQPDFRMTREQELAFNEEPVRILIHRGQEKTASKTTDYIAINGLAAEVYFKNGFVPIGYLPKGVAFTTKRKYLAVIAGAKVEQIGTRVIERDNEDPNNLIERTVTAPLPFVVIEDKNPRGAEWLQGVTQRGL